MMVLALSLTMLCSSYHKEPLSFSIFHLTFYVDFSNAPAPFERQINAVKLWSKHIFSWMNKFHERTINSTIFPIAIFLFLFIAYMSLAYHWALNTLIQNQQKVKNRKNKKIKIAQRQKLMMILLLVLNSCAKINMHIKRFVIKHRYCCRFFNSNGYCFSNGN